MRPSPTRLQKAPLVDSDLVDINVVTKPLYRAGLAGQSAENLGRGCWESDRRRSVVCLGVPGTRRKVVTSWSGSYGASLVDPRISLVPQG